MKIVYQGNPGSYMHMASEDYIKNHPYINNGAIGVPTFDEVWEAIDVSTLGLLAIENSYMGSIHHNLYRFLDYPYTIIGEIYLPINHCLCSRETSIKNIKQVFSQAPALSQCKNYIKKRGFFPREYSDTALSAAYIAKNTIENAGAICSELAAEIYNLNILEKNIADQTNNTTRFVIISSDTREQGVAKASYKTSLLFRLLDTPGSLYNSLGIFTKHHINLLKIESLPAFNDPFSYIFWIDIEGNMLDRNIGACLEELGNFTKNIRIVGSYGNTYTPSLYL